jgi:hypothetical protein
MVDLHEPFQGFLQQTQAMARHSDPKTTKIYFHNLNRIYAGAERFIEIGGLKGGNL